MWFPLVLATALAATVLGQEEFASECPSPDGFFADAVQCDKYYECRDSIISEKLCPDGMAFNDLNFKVEKCDFHFQVDCKGRPELQPPLGAPDCPHANGYFPHPDPGNCNVFSYCSQGTASTITCPENLVFSIQTGTCTWPDQSGRKDCDSKAVLNFTCPIEDANIASAHPRYADPNDCQYFFVCISGVTPRHNGCKFGDVFSSETQACDAPGAVPECERYYWDYFEEYFNTLGAGSNRASHEVIEAALKSNYPVPETARIRIEKPRINSPNRRRQPVKASVPATPVRSSSPAVLAAAPEQPAAPAQADPRPQTGTRVPIRRRRPGVRRKKTTTTTSTTTPPPEYYYDYDYPADYYEDQPAEPAPQPAEPAPAPPSNTPTFRSLRPRA